MIPSRNVFCTGNQPPSSQPPPPPSTGAEAAPLPPPSAPPENMVDAVQGYEGVTFQSGLANLFLSSVICGSQLSVILHICELICILTVVSPLSAYHMIIHMHIIFHTCSYIPNFAQFIILWSFAGTEGYVAPPSYTEVVDDSNQDTPQPPPTSSAWVWLYDNTKKETNHTCNFLTVCFPFVPLKSLLLHFAFSETEWVIIILTVYKSRNARILLYQFNTNCVRFMHVHATYEMNYGMFFQSR